MNHAYTILVDPARTAVISGAANPDHVYLDQNLMRHERIRVYDEDAVLRLAVALYDRDSVKAAELCDEVLDPSGALLGRVRQVART